MSAAGQLGSDFGCDSRLDLNIATAKRSLGKPGRLERRLDVELMINDIRNKLGMRLGLIPTAHDAEGNAHLVPGHECRNNCVKRSFVAGEQVRTLRVEAEQAAAILQPKSGAGGDNA